MAGLGEVETAGLGEVETAGLGEVETAVSGADVADVAAGFVMKALLLK